MTVSMTESGNRLRAILKESGFGDDEMLFGALETLTANLPPAPPPSAALAALMNLSPGTAPGDTPVTNSANSNVIQIAMAKSFVSARLRRPGLIAAGAAVAMILGGGAAAAALPDFRATYADVVRMVQEPEHAFQGRLPVQDPAPTPAPPGTVTVSDPDGGTIVEPFPGGVTAEEPDSSQDHIQEDARPADPVPAPATEEFPAEQSAPPVPISNPVLPRDIVPPAIRDVAGPASRQAKSSLKPTAVPDAGSGWKATAGDAATSPGNPNSRKSLNGIAHSSQAVSKASENSSSVAADSLPKVGNPQSAGADGKDPSKAFEEPVAKTSGNSSSTKK